MPKYQNYESFPKNLYLIRTQKGISQRELADLIGVTQEQIAHYEDGSMPSPSKLEAIAKALNVRVKTLIEPIPESMTSVGRLSKSRKSIFEKLRTIHDALDQIEDKQEALAALRQLSLTSRSLIRLVKTEIEEIEKEIGNSC